MKLSTIILSAFAVFGLACSANAVPWTVTDLGEFMTADQSDTKTGPGSIVYVANNNANVDTPEGPGDLVLFRLNGVGTTVSTTYGTFVVTDLGSNMYSLAITGTLNDSWVVAGVAIHAGNGQTDEFFRVNDQNSGSGGPFFGPMANASLSNFDVLLENDGAPAVPDGGTTAMLLGSALGALGLVQRFFWR
jgi:hypothetical protein